MTRKIDHQIDPNGDTILVLKNPGAAFAVWDEHPVEAKIEKKVGSKSKLAPVPSEHGWPTTYNDALGDSLWPSQTLSKKKGKKGPSLDAWGSRNAVPLSLKQLGTRASPARKIKPAPETVADALEGLSVAHESLFSDGTSSLAIAGSSSGTFQTIPKDLAIQDGADSGAGAGEESPEEEEGIRFLVSSRHLALASGYFKSSLSREGWMEGTPSKVDGMYHLSASDWYVDAFLIFLNILHLQNRQVPRSVTLEMLAKMAVLIDYYRCAETVEIFTDMWINEVKTTSPVPPIYGRELVLWMCVAWVFKQPIEFKTATEIAIKQCNAPTIRDMELPISKPVLDAIEHKRYQMIESLVQELHDWLEKFRGQSYDCPGTYYSNRSNQLDKSNQSFVCSSVLFGALTKEMDRIKGLFPRPEVPFPSLSFEQLCVDIRTIKSPTWYDSQPNYRPDLHPCSFRGTVIKSIDQVGSTEAGLSLDDFKVRTDWWRA